MRKFVVIVAGGKSVRMGGDIPKQFIEIKGKPVLMHTIEKFYNYDKLISIVIVLPHLQIAYWEELCRKYNFGIRHRVVEGGHERFFSVRNGLEAITDDNSLVAIHDGVRPLVSEETIARCFEVAETSQCAVPAVPAVDSIRIVTAGEGNKAVDRSLVRLVQTPQTFNTTLLKKAFYQQWEARFTDDASVFESDGNVVTLVEGNVENIKITSPADLIIAENLMR